MENPCIVCQKCTSGAHKCRKCKNYVHIICGTSDSEEGYGSEIICQICEKANTTLEIRSKSLECLKIQGEKMLTRSSTSLRPIEIGKSVTISIPNVDKGRIDSQYNGCGSRANRQQIQVRHY